MGCCPGYAYLNLQNFIAAETLVVHLVVGIIRVATIFVFNEGESAVYHVSEWDGDRN